jgi:voltage-gated potassium channel
MRGFRLLFAVIRHSGMQRVLIWFFVVFLICAAIITLVEPGIASLPDALWFLWAVSPTIGLGDMTAVTIPGRLATVACSVAGLVTFAILTAVVVDYYNERRQMQISESTALLLDRLEHLEDLGRDELADISRKVRSLQQ